MIVLAWLAVFGGFGMVLFDILEAPRDGWTKVHVGVIVTVLVLLIQVGPIVVPD